VKFVHQVIEPYYICHANQLEVEVFTNLTLIAGFRKWVRFSLSQN